MHLASVHIKDKHHKLHQSQVSSKSISHWLMLYWNKKSRKSRALHPKYQGGRRVYSQQLMWADLLMRKMAWALHSIGTLSSTSVSSHHWTIGTGMSTWFRKPCSHKALLETTQLRRRSKTWSAVWLKTSTELYRKVPYLRPWRRLSKS